MAVKEKGPFLLEKQLPSRGEQADPSGLQGDGCATSMDPSEVPRDSCAGGHRSWKRPRSASISHTQRGKHEP